jgi:large repetitive protein
MCFQSLLYRSRWFHAPAGILMMLLQRTPVLRVFAGGSVEIGIRSGDLLKSAFALTALGAYNSVAGATVFNSTVVAPTTVNPASGSANSTFTASGASGAAFSVAFSGSGAPSTIKSWKVTGTFPPGLSVTGGTAITGGYTFNGLKVTIAGTPTTAGNNTLTVTAYDSTGATGNNARVSCAINITSTSSAPTFTTQPSSQTVNAGANATFTIVATGTPAPTLQWYKDNVALSGQTSATLSLTNVQSANTGSYKVVATNSAAPSGITSNTATLTLAQTITFGALSGKIYGDAPFTVSATASSSLTPTFSIVSGPATISGSTVTITGTGTAVIRASQAGNTSYAAATSVDQSFSVTQAAQTITFGALSGKTYGNAPFTVSATASSGLTPTFSIVSGPATISGTTITLTGAGTVVVRASQTGNANYAAAPPVDQSFSVAQAAQTITFSALSSKIYGDAPFTVSASASSGLTPTFSIVSGPATISGSTVTLTGAGTVVVRASQSGNTNYAAATAVDQSFSVTQASQTITFGALSSKAYGDVPFTVSATASSSLTPTFSIVSGPATISGSTVTITGTGTVIVRASQSGNANYAAATPVDQSFTVGLTSQSITFGALTGKTYGDVPFTVSATASSGLSPTFSIVSGPATISGSTVTITGVGTVVVRAGQAGDSNYAAATPVDQSFSVSKATATVTLGSLSQPFSGSALSATATTTPGGLTVAFTYNASATAPTNAGTYAVVGTINDSLYQGSANGTLVISQAAQSITFGALSAKTYGATSFTVSATASSGLTPTFSVVSGPATISGSTVTITGVGTVVVRAGQAGNTNYTAATAVDQSFSVAQAPQTITFGALSSKAYGDVPFTVSATASSGLSPTFSIVSGPATISGSTITLTGTGTVIVRASQAGNANYAAATPVDQSFSVTQASQTITFGALSSKAYGDVPFSVSATASSGLSPTFSIVSGPATVSGSTVTITGVGTVVVRASQAGNSNYAAATPVDQSFAVSKATATVTLGSLSQSYTGSALSASASTTPGSLTVTFTYNASSTAPTTVGSYAVVGTINDTLYQGSANGTLVISQAAQTITFGALSAKTYGDAPFTVSATASSSLTPTFSIVSGPATISGSTVTLTGGGIVIVRASQAGNANYSAATPVDQSFSVGSVPVFTTQPSTQSVVTGNTVTFTAAVSGYPTPTLQWYKDSTPLSGKTSATLSITNAQSGDEGSYTVVATNASAPSGVSSNAAALTVNPAPAAPVFTTHPATQTVTAGDTVTFTAAATGVPTPTFQWYKDNGILQGQTSSTLSLTNVQSGAAGSYTVKAINSAAPSGVLSNAASLTVNPAPAAPVFTTHPATQTAVTGSTVTLTAVVTGYPAPTLQWYQDNAPLSGKTSSTLSITNVQSADAGAYTVVATNASAPSGVSSNAATLTVNEAPVAPVFTTQPGAQTVTIGDDVAFTVAVTGNPSPTLQWYKNNAILSGQTGLTLSLANVQLTDAGTYTVKAFNSSAPSGVSSNSAALTVQVPAPAALAPRSVHIGERVAFDLTGGATYPAGIVFYASKLPAGFLLDSATGQLTGLVSGKPGTVTITCWTQSSATKSVSRTLTLTVLAFPSSFSGKYETLIEDSSPDAEAPFPVGKVELAVTSGAFTGRLTTTDSKPYSFKGTLELGSDLTTGDATVSVARAKGLTPSAYQLAVTVSQDGSMHATLSSLAGTFGDGTGSKLAGTATPATYTMLVREPVNLGVTDAYPHGDGYFSATASSAGVLTMKGKLADGTVVTASTAFGADRALRPYIKPYAKAAGYLAGTLQLTARADNAALTHLTADNGSDFYWVKPALAKTASYPGGFGPLAVQAVMEPWNATAFGTRLGLASDGNFTVTILGDYQSNTGPGTNSALPVTLNLSTANQLAVAGANPSSWSLKLNAKTGVFTGTCYPTDKLAAHKATVDGVLSQPAPGDTLIGGGYLLAPAQNASQSTSTSSVEFTVAR